MKIVTDLLTGRVREYEFDERGVASIKEPEDGGGSSRTDIDLTKKFSLVVRDSEVETAIDGIFGHYRTRTKGSLLVRKDLPNALKPFIQQTNRPSPLKALTLG